MGHSHNCEIGRLRKLARHWALACAAATTLSGLAAAPAGAFAGPEPKAPTNVTVAALTDHTIQLSWKDASNNESGFEIDDGETKKTVESGATSYLWVGSPYKRVCFRVRAVGESGTTPLASKPASDWVPKESESLCARTPSEGENLLAFPLTSGIRAEGGATGLHGHQYGCISAVAGKCRSDSGYIMKEADKHYALDFVPEDAYAELNDPGRKSGNYPVLSMEDGTVKIVWPDCNAVVVDGGADIWILYIHVDPDPDLRAGQGVDTGDPLGTIVKRGETACEQDVPVAHVHVSLLTPTGKNTAKYIDFVGQSLCGHEVRRRPGNASYGDGSNMLLDGLTKTTTGEFTVPAC